MANVGYILPELAAVQKQYEEIDDCVAGQTKIKSRKQRYLPKPNAHDQSRANDLRYENYLTRAVFYNVVRRTLNGLTGQVFSREPDIKLPAGMTMLNKDANGTGIGLIQLGKQITRSVLSKGRAGIHTDYPDTGPDGASRAQIESGFLYPTINYYKPNEIINWRITTVGARDLLSLVVLKEEYVKQDDGFEKKTEKQYRVLRLVNGVYVVEIYRGRQLTSPMFRWTPLKANGQPFNEIPFTFVGIDNNDPEIDEPPMYDLASLNIAHYRNSADFEEMCFMLGQPTPWFSGLTQEWVDDVLKGTIELGSRAAVPLPVDAEAGLLQLNETSLVGTAMEHKERQMVALGARLVEQKSVQRTAQEARMDAGTEASTLVSAAVNVSEAMEFALKQAGEFTGEAVADGCYALNTEYELSTLTPEELKQVIASWQQEAISWTEMRTRLRHSGLASQTDDKARAEIEQEVSARADRVIEETKRQVEAGLGDEDTE